MQDDAKDWHRHAAIMGQIYHNAYLTIAADVFQEDSDMKMSKSVDSLFSDIPPYYSPRILQFAHPFQAGMTTAVGARMVRKHYYSHLMDRGWIFQEDLLSRRYLRFRNHDIVMQCVEQKCAGCSLQSDCTTPRATVNSRMFPSLREEIELNLSPSERVQLWHKIIERYVRLHDVATSTAKTCLFLCSLLS